MTGKKKLFIIIVIFIVLIAGIFVFLRIRENLTSSQKRPAPVVSIRVTQPVRGDISSKLSFSGDIAAIQQTNIYSRVTGNIQNLYADIGDFVSAGKLLATIDRSTYYQTVRQTEGLLVQARATLENNKVNLERAKLLFEKGLLSQSELDNAETLVKVSDAQVGSAEASYNNSRIQLGYCNITAPFSGYITKRLLDRGALVSSSPQGQNSIFILSDISRLKVIVNVLEKDIPSLVYVKDVTLTTDVYPDEVFSATFNKISQAVDLSTRTMPAEINIENKGNLLKPGMFVKVELILEEHKNALLLPSHCFDKDETGEFVFVISSDSTAVKKYVQTGIQADNKTEIISGLGDTDNVVIVGQELIKEKDKVKVIQ